jgi:hypothetical protein
MIQDYEELHVRKMLYRRIGALKSRRKGLQTRTPNPESRVPSPEPRFLQ